MKLFRLLGLLGGVGLLLAGTTSCLKAPNYSTTPEISFDHIELVSKRTATQVIDSVSITIRYQDGDGDLGLSSTESQASPYAGTQFANNYFVEPYVKTVSGQFVRLADDPSRNITVGAYNSRFEHISTGTDGRSLPIKGTLTWGAGFLPYFPIKPGEEVRFEVTIADRAQHISNTVTTSSIIFPN